LSNLGEVTSVLPVSVGDLARSVSPTRIRAGTGTDHEPESRGRCDRRGRSLFKASYGRTKIIKEDWKSIFNDDQPDYLIKQMLQLDHINR
jgi:hypothetical protein